MMKKIFVVFFVFFIFSFSSNEAENMQIYGITNPPHNTVTFFKKNNTNNSTSKNSLLYLRRVLVLGDSHMVGKFAEHLHSNLHQVDFFDIMSIAIGGAGTRNFTNTMRNYCCGYVIRRSQDQIASANPIQVQRIESGGGKTDEIVGKRFHGKLKNVLSYFDPHIVIIALGNNVINDHSTLINLIKKSNNETQIIWLGPILKQNTQRQLGSITEVTGYYDIQLIRSDDIVGDANVRSIHFYGRTLEIWAKTVVERMTPYIQTNFPQVTTQPKTHQIKRIFPGLLSYPEDAIIENLIQKQTPIAQTLSTILNDEYHFSHKFLLRQYGDYNLKEKAPDYVVDIDGNTYKTIIIGNQCWMADNLRTTRFNNGTPIPKMDYHTAAFSEENPIYRTNPPTTKTNLIHSGLLYSWNAINNQNNVCPKGWHVPDIADWEYIADYMDNIYEFINGSTSITYNEQFLDIQNTHYTWWTSDQVEDNTNSAWVRTIDRSKSQFYYINKQKNMALPIRCVMD
jgi:hypothetical protein